MSGEPSVSTSSLPSAGPSLGTMFGGTRRPRIRLNIGPDLAQLREMHLALLRLWNEGASERSVAQAEELRETAAKAGSVIEGPADRDAAQGIIDYWTSAIAALPDEQFPSLLQLDEPQTANRDAIKRSAEDALESFKAEGKENEFRLVLLSLLPENQRAAGDTFSVEEQAVLTSTKADDVRTELVARGLARHPVLDGDPDLLIHEALLRKWPQADLWCKEMAFEAAKYDKLAAEAENWVSHDRSKAYLLRGRALWDALPFLGKGSPLDDLITESARARRIARVQIGGLALTVLLVGTGIVFLNRFQSYYQGFATGNSTGLNYRSEIPDPASLVNAKADVSGAAPLTTPSFLWAGNETTPLLTDLNGNLVDPADLIPGQIYRVSTDIMLRAALPDPGTYQSKLSIGFILAKGKVRILDKPVAFERDTGTQYWARMQRIQSIFIKYYGDNTGKANELAAALRKRGYDVQPMKSDAGAKGAYQIRYSFPQEVDLAQTLADTVLSLDRPRAGLAAQCYQLPRGIRNWPGTFEISIDFSAVEGRLDRTRPPMTVSCVQPPESSPGTAGPLP